MLVLPIKKKWFYMIKSGEKKEEYREIKPYWTKRFYNLLEHTHVHLYNCEINLISARGTVVFKNGYSKNAPQIKCFVQLSQDYGKPEWGAKPNKKYYVLEILSVEEIKN